MLDETTEEKGRGSNGVKYSSSYYDYYTNYSITFSTTLT